MRKLLKEDWDRKTGKILKGVSPENKLDMLLILKIELGHIEGQQMQFLLVFFLLLLLLLLRMRKSKRGAAYVLKNDQCRKPFRMVGIMLKIL